MSVVALATLQRLRYARRPSKDKPATVRPEGPALEVQFNPASLKISRRNNVDRGGVAAGGMKRTQPAAESADLSFDLEFDTAEQGSAGSPVDVRLWTAVVRQFVEPPADPKSGPPPAVRFAWGTIVFDGIIDDVTEDLDHFAPDGTPLRAKVSVKIAEQNFSYERLEKPPAAGDARNATKPGGTSGQDLGRSGTSNPTQVTAAQDGESVQQLLSRLGLSPQAWRAAMTGLTSPLALPAGQPVLLGDEVDGAGTPAAATGFTAGAVSGSPGALATALSGSATTGDAGDRAGFTLSTAGGLGAAVAAVARDAVATAEQAARAAFAVPAAGSAAAAGAAAAAAGAASAASGVVTAVTAEVDRRATGYGRSIPLRARGDAATLARSGRAGAASLSARARRVEVDLAEAVAPPWAALPATGREVADQVQRRRDAARRTLGGGGDGG